ncbi:hypothetical protein ACVNIS_08740 [Sphaerotilaceae bacterium SBD11-9]
MTIGTQRILDVIAPDEPCLGALFTTFTFDPAFFENHVLRAVLRLSSDPIEQPERYHQECRRALQQVPVAVVVDAGERQGGRRLPYDLLDVSSVVFHPKTVLLLFRGHARLVVGSGNLTSNGYGSNSELFFHADLRFDTPADVGALATFRAHLQRIAPLMRTRGSQIALFEEALGRAIGSAADASTPASFRLLDSTAGPILQQALALLPPAAKLKTIGLAAPFFEKDDGELKKGAEGELDASSVFGALLERADGQVEVDVAIGWDNVTLHATDPVAVEEGIGRLWTWEYQAEGETRHDHLVPTSFGRKEFRYRNERGREVRWPVADARKAIEARKLWMQPEPEACVPKLLLSAAREKASKLRLWLHPSTRLVDGRPQCRPLHAKLLTLGYESAGEAGTLLIMGSPNMSRRALLLAAGAGGNVEVAVALRVRGLLALPDLMPGVVHAPEGSVSMVDRQFPDATVNHALAVERAVHDAQARTLEVRWSADAARVPGWRLMYQSRMLASSVQPPTETLQVEPFVLQPASAELSLQVEGQAFLIPILVSDLVQLPADATAPPLSLDELLLLAARRIGGERAVQMARMRAERTPDGGADDELAAFFRDRFTPTDVFRAWWCAAEDLRKPELSVTAFRLALEGAMGTSAVWAAIHGAASSRHMLAEEAWLYGAELLRSLSDVTWPGNDTGESLAKQQVLSGFIERVQADLRSLLAGRPDDELLRKVRAFYAETCEERCA